ncbi:MAG: hypothetical protein ACR2KQ_07335 [Actinomycetota bacterium]
MKKLLILALVASLIAGALIGPAAAGKKKKKKKKPQRVERVVEMEYQLAALGVGDPAGTGACPAATNSCGRAATGPEDRWVKVEITDATGTPTSFSLGQDTDPDALGTEKDLGEFCGSTGDEPIEIEPGFEILVFPWLLGPACQSAGTTGTVTMTISNLP